MIKTKRGKVLVKGTRKEIMADFPIIVTSIYERFLSDLPIEKRKEVIRRLVEFAMMTGEEQKAEILKTVMESYEQLADLIAKKCEEEAAE